MRSLNLTLLLCSIAWSEAAVLEAFKERPVNDLQSIVSKAVAVTGKYPGSVAIQTQYLTWISQLSVQELAELEEKIPSPWTGSQLSSDSMSINIRQSLKTATRDKVKDAEVYKLDFYYARGRQTTTHDYEKTLTQVKLIEDEKTRDQFLKGMLVSLGRETTFTSGQAKRDHVITLISQAERIHINTYSWPKWAALWPANNIANYANTLSEDDRFRMIRHIAEHGSYYFSNFDEGLRYLKHFGYSAPGQKPVIGESMGAVFAARTPMAFVEWFEKQPQSSTMQHCAIQNAIEPLLRNEPQLIRRITPFFNDSSSYTALEVAREWARYEPKKAEKWAATLPASKTFDTFKLHELGRAHHLDQKRLSQALNRRNKVQMADLIRPKKTLKKLKINRESLTKLTSPGASLLVNKELYQCVFSLSAEKVEALFNSYVQHPPGDARDALVRMYLLESWVW
jgi:hypothetical protein